MSAICRRALAMLLISALLLPCLPAAAAASSQVSLPSQLAAFREKYGLTEQNFALSYRNTVTGESYSFNDTAFFPAGSTYKLPLNVYYYEQEAAGVFDDSLSIEGCSLAECHYRSLVLSDNDISIAMLYHLGTFWEYKSCIFPYGGMDDAEMAYIYWVDNYFCTRYMLGVLQYVYDRQDAFSELLGYMKQAQPGQYLAAYGRDYAVAHKYGLFEEAINDVAIVYTPMPYLVACFTNGLANGWEVLAQVNALLCDYTVQASAILSRTAQLLMQLCERFHSAAQRILETVAQWSPHLAGQNRLSAQLSSPAPARSVRPSPLSQAPPPINLRQSSNCLANPRLHL